MFYSVCSLWTTTDGSHPILDCRPIQNCGSLVSVLFWFSSKNLPKLSTICLATPLSSPLRFLSVSQVRIDFPLANPSLVHEISLSASGSNPTTYFWKIQSPKCEWWGVRKGRACTISVFVAFSIKNRALGSAPLLMGHWPMLVIVLAKVGVRPPMAWYLWS